MKKHISVLMALCTVFLLSVGAQARILKPSPKFPSASPDERSDVSKGIYVGDELVTFSETLLFDGRMSVMLPDYFTDMEPELAKMKYTNIGRPQIIKSNSEATVDFLFTYVEDGPILPSELSGFTKRVKEVLKKASPSMEFYNGRTETLGVKLSWFDFKSHAIDADIYNVRIFFPIDGKLVMMGFNCSFADRKKWIPVIQAVLPTIKECEIK